MENNNKIGIPGRTFMGKTANGIYVFDKTSYSQLRPSQKLIQTALSKISFINDYEEITLDMGEIVGFSTCVQTTINDEIIFATRKDGKIIARFVKNRESEPTSLITIILKKEPLSNYSASIVSAWFGGNREKELGDRNITGDEEYSKVITFWLEHALIYECHKAEIKTILRARDE